MNPLPSAPPAQTGQRLRAASGDSSAQLQAPGLWRRMACWLYEGVLLFAVVFFAGWLFSTLAQMRDAADGSRHPIFQGFLFVVLGVYFTWFWSRGQTLAMKTWNIRIVDALGQPVTQRRALLRYVLAWVWFLPPLGAMSFFPVSGGEAVVVVFGWVAVWAVLSRFQRQGQFWHDVWAGTRLVQSAGRRG